MPAARRRLDRPASRRPRPRDRSARPGPSHRRGPAPPRRGRRRVTVTQQAVRRRLDRAPRPRRPPRAWRRWPAPRRRRSRRCSRRAGRTARRGTSSVTGTGVRAVSDAIAAARPRWASTDGSSPAPRSRSSRIASWVSSSASAIARCAGLVAGAAPRRLQREDDVDEPLLGPVVQVAAEAPALVEGGLDDARARGVDRLGAQPLGLGALALGDVAEHHHRPAPLADRHRRRRVGDRHERAVAADEPVLVDPDRARRSGAGAAAGTPPRGRGGRRGGCGGWWRGWGGRSARSRTRSRGCPPRRRWRTGRRPASSTAYTASAMLAISAESSSASSSPGAWRSAQAIRQRSCQRPGPPRGGPGRLACRAGGASRRATSRRARRADRAWCVRRGTRGCCR